jgi:hypothetical protein
MHMPAWARHSALIGKSLLGKCTGCLNEIYVDDFLDFGRIVSRPLDEVLLTTDDPNSQFNLLCRKVGFSESELWWRLEEFQAINPDHAEEIPPLARFAETQVDIFTEAVALKLLLEYLNKHQRRTFLRAGYFDLRSQSGRPFRIYGKRHNGVQLLNERSRPIANYCIGLGEQIPVYDTVLSALLGLKADEEAFMSIANELPYEYPCRRPPHHKEMMRSIKEMWKEGYISASFRAFKQLPDEVMPIPHEQAPKPRLGLRREAVRLRLIQRKADLLSDICGIIAIASAALESHT